MVEVAAVSGQAVEHPADLRRVRVHILHTRRHTNSEREGGEGVSH